jgi:hypothetical protein
LWHAASGLPQGRSNGIPLGLYGHCQPSARFGEQFASVFGEQTAADATKKTVGMSANGDRKAESEEFLRSRFASRANRIAAKLPTAAISPDLTPIFSLKFFLPTADNKPDHLWKFQAAC